MSTLAVSYTLSEEARKRIGIETGNIPANDQTQTFDISTATMQQRAILLLCPSTFVTSDGLTKISICRMVGKATSDRAVLPIDTHPLTIDDVVSHAARMTAEHQAARIKHYSDYVARLVAGLNKAINTKSVREPEMLSQADREAIDALGIDLAQFWSLKQAYQDARPAWIVSEETAQAAREAREAEQKAEAKRKADEAQQAKLAWIEAHGSDYLKRCIAAGHDCARQYWIERAAQEYPGFVLDFEKHATWKDRSCPSALSLDVRDVTMAAHPGVKATIVWLTSEPKDRHVSPEFDEILYEEPSYEREALVVDDPAYTRCLIL